VKQETLIESARREAGDADRETVLCYGLGTRLSRLSHSFLEPIAALSLNVLRSFLQLTPQPPAQQAQQAQGRRGKTARAARACGPQSGGTARRVVG
jgi:hypothetical protein